MSFYGKRMVEAGLLREVYDEPSGRWKIDADGDAMQMVYDVWSVAAKVGRDTGAHLQLGDDCPLDASIVVVWCYLVVFRDPEARVQLHRYASSLRGMSPEELRPHEAFVHGGFLMGLVMPQPGPDGRMLDPPLVNVLDAYLHLMEDNLRRAQEIHANS